MEEIRRRLDENDVYQETSLHRTKRTNAQSNKFPRKTEQEVRLLRAYRTKKPGLFAHSEQENMFVIVDTEQEKPTYVFCYVLCTVSDFLCTVFFE